MHADDPSAAMVAARAPASSVSSAGSSSVSNAASAVAVMAASAGSKRKSRAADDAAAAEATVAASSSVPASSRMQSSQEGPPTAASSVALSADAASSAHLASVLESPSAFAPIAKRTRRAAQSAAAAAAQAQSSPMMRLLGADSGARQSLLESMDLSSIARLQCTGRSWRSWIAEAPSIGARTVNIQRKAAGPGASHCRCPWIRRSVQHLQFVDNQDSCDDEDPLAEFDQLLILPWSRLRSIKATFYRFLPHVEMLRASFASVAATVHRLNVSLQWDAALSAANLLPAISSLHQLESLTVDVLCDLTGLDLSALPALPRLQQFTLHSLDYPCSRPCSPAQVTVLAQCKSLTDLECGTWLPQYTDPVTVVQLTAAQLQQIENGLGRLFRLRKDNGASPLRRLDLGRDSIILPPCWRVLSQFTALEELHAWWSCELTAGDWMLLALFPQLRSLRIVALEYENNRPLLNLGLVLPALVRCRALRTLHINGALELRTEHAALLAQVPSLASFVGSSLRVESLEPLSKAPALTELRFSWCSGLYGEPINMRALIPPMPLVSKLTIFDNNHSPLSAPEAEPFDAALFARLPRLTPEQFLAD